MQGDTFYIVGGVWKEVSLQALELVEYKCPLGKSFVPSYSHNATHLVIESLPRWQLFFLGGWRHVKEFVLGHCGVVFNLI